MPRNTNKHYRDTATDIGRAIALSEVNHRIRHQGDRRIVWTDEQILDLFVALVDGGWAKRGATLRAVKRAYDRVWADFVAGEPTPKTASLWACHLGRHLHGRGPRGGETIWMQYCPEDVIARVRGRL